MSNHGWVNKNQDGTVARCGGPGLCSQCSQEKIMSIENVQITTETKEIGGLNDFCDALQAVMKERFQISDNDCNQIFNDAFKKMIKAYG